MEAILNQIKPCVHTEGKSDAFADYQINNSFNDFYSWCITNPENFRIQCRKLNNDQISEFVLTPVSAGQFKLLLEQSFTNKNPVEPLSYEFPESNIAIVRIRSFNYSVNRSPFFNFTESCFQ